MEHAKEQNPLMQMEPTLKQRRSRNLAVISLSLMDAEITGPIEGGNENLCLHEEFAPSTMSSTCFCCKCFH